MVSIYSYNLVDSLQALRRLPSSTLYRRKSINHGIIDILDTRDFLGTYMYKTIYMMYLSLMLILILMSEQRKYQLRIVPLKIIHDNFILHEKYPQKNIFGMKNFHTKLSSISHMNNYSMTQLSWVISAGTLGNVDVA